MDTATITLITTQVISLICLIISEILPFTNIPAQGIIQGILNAFKPIAVLTPPTPAIIIPQTITNKEL